MLPRVTTVFDIFSWKEGKNQPSVPIRGKEDSVGKVWEMGSKGQAGVSSFVWESFGFFFGVLEPPRNASRSTRWGRR